MIEAQRVALPVHGLRLLEPVLELIRLKVWSDSPSGLDLRISTIEEDVVVGAIGSVDCRCSIGIVWSVPFGSGSLCFFLCVEWICVSVVGLDCPLVSVSLVPATPIEILDPSDPQRLQIHRSSLVAAVFPLEHIVNRHTLGVVIERRLIDLCHCLFKVGIVVCDVRCRAADVIAVCRSALDVDGVTLIHPNCRVIAQSF